MSVLAYSKGINLGVSALILLVALIIYRAKPKAFQDSPFLQHVQFFWILQWTAFLLIWLFMQNKPTGPLDLRWVLLAVDLQTVLALGVLAAISEAENYSARQNAIDLYLLFLVVTFWNFGAAGWLSQHDFEAGRSAWILPSQTLSAATLTLVGVGATARFGKGGAFFLACSVIYLILQRPVYVATFVRGEIMPDWNLILAFGKILYATSFYVVLLLVPPRSKEPFSLTTIWLRNEKLARIAQWAVPALGGLVMSVLGKFVAEWIGSMIR